MAYASKFPLNAEAVEVDHNKQSLWNYCEVSEICSSKDLGEYRTYGISVNGLYFSETLHDVSLHKAVIARMTYLFNKHQLSPIHFKDAVEDMLGFLE